MVEFSGLEIDALAEVFNIGVGHAAGALSTMVDDEILLSVPLVDFVTRTEAAIRLSAEVGRRICAVKQQFEGGLDTEAILMFPEEKSLELVRVMVGTNVPLEQLGEMEQDAMSEIGNIILNSVVGTIADLFSTMFDGSLPQVQSGTSEEILGTHSEDERNVLMLHIDFRIERLQTRGYLAFLLGIPSMELLRDGVRRFLAGA